MFLFLICTCIRWKYICLYLKHLTKMTKIWYVIFYNAGLLNTAVLRTSDKSTSRINKNVGKMYKSDKSILFWYPQRVRFTRDIYKWTLWSVSWVTHLATCRLHDLRGWHLARCPSGYVTWDLIGSMLGWRRPSVCDAGPASTQHYDGSTCLSPRHTGTDPEGQYWR